MNGAISSKSFLVLGCVILFLVILSFNLDPKIQGDGVSYLQAIHFLRDGQVPAEPIFHRLLTTFGSIFIISFLSGIIGNEIAIWFAMNASLYAGMIIAFYKLVYEIHKDVKTAFASALFLAGNYSILQFGLDFLMDMGGWAFYTFSLLFTFRYFYHGDRKDIILASVMVGVGGLFKEYAFLAVIPIAAALLYHCRHNLRQVFYKSILPAIISVAPVALVHIWVYSNYGYTYMDWLSSNQEHYVYSSRVVEYIKSFGSLFNILGIIFVAGIIAIYKNWQNLDLKLKFFILSVLLSVLPIFFWPAITQRVLFITVPFVVILSSFVINRLDRRWYLFLPIIFAYIGISLLMDSFLLDFVNLPF